MAPVRLIAAAFVPLLALPAAVDARQEGVEADTIAAPADTVQADTSATGAGEGPASSFPDRLEAGTDRTAAHVETWTRDDLLDSSAHSLQDFLLDHASGVLPLRAGFFFGPHQLADGPWTAGGVRIVVDGRELPPLASGQADVSRISLATLERIRLVRRAGGTVLEVTTLDHEGDEAYSRISAGTGQPGADGIRGLFTNAAGQDFTVQGAVDHLNVGVGEMSGNRLDAWAKLSWMPGAGGTGVEVIWRSEAVERTLRDSTVELDRGELFLHGRTILADGLQADAWVGRTTRDPRPAFFPEEMTPSDTLPPDSVGSDSLPGDMDEAGPESFDVRQLAGSLTYRGEDLFLRASGGTLEGKGTPDFEGELRGSVRLGPLVAEGGLEAASWERVSTSAWSGGIAYRPGWWEGAALRVEAVTGSRAIPRPERAVGDSLVQDYDAISAGTELELGPYRLSGTVARKNLDRQLPFGGFFDRTLPATGEISLTDLEARVEGPLIPLGFFGDHLTLRGFWRSSRPADEEGASPYYLPETLARGEGLFRHTFFEDNLEVRLVGRVVHRDVMITAGSGEDGLVTLPAETTFRSEVVIRIDTFRIWWRTDNLSGVEQRDFGELVFPATRNVFGVRWEFFD